MSQMNAQSRTNQIELNELVMDVVDTVATFDGRISYTPSTLEGVCTLDFQSTRERFLLLIDAKVDSEQHTVIFSQWTQPRGKTKVSNPVYNGPFDKRAIRYQLSEYLAGWYGQVVRFQSFPL